MTHDQYGYKIKISRRNVINLGQGHHLTLASMLSIASSSLKPLGQSQRNFHVEHPWVGETKIPYMVKNTQKSSFAEPAG